MAKNLLCTENNERHSQNDFVGTHLCYMFSEIWNTWFCVLVGLKQSLCVAVGVAGRGPQAEVLPQLGTRVDSSRFPPREP
jgi:hypothetical protein